MVVPIEGLTSLTVKLTAFKILVVCLPEITKNMMPYQESAMLVDNLIGHAFGHNHIAGEMSFRQSCFMVKLDKLK